MNVLKEIENGGIEVVRFSFVDSEEKIKEAVSRIGRFLAR